MLNVYNYPNQIVKRVMLLVVALLITIFGYSQAPDTWMQKADFTYTSPNEVTPEPRTSAVSFTIGNKGYIGTGYGAGNQVLKDFWEYNSYNNSWSQKADFGGDPRWGATGFAIGYKGYIGTGADGSYNYYKDFWEYDQLTNTWTQMADFDGVARNEAAAFTADALGYISTGYNGTDLKDTWQYNPSLDSWTQKADFGGGLRSGASSFSIDRKGFLGTGKTNGLGKKDFWEYNSGENKWIQKADFGGSPRYGAVGFRIGNKGYLGTGRIDNYGSNDFWEYNPVSNAWIKKSDFAGGNRSFASGFSIGDKGYIVAGIEIIYAKDFWEYDQYLNAWAQNNEFGPRTRNNAVGFSIDNKGYIGLGQDWVVKQDFWEYDPVYDTWTQKADFGGGLRIASAGFSIGNKGYVGTGYGNDGLTRDFWEYDPLTNTWTKKKDFGGTARSGAVGLNIGDKGYIGTGLYYDFYYNSFYAKDFWEYDPVSDGWTKKADFAGGPRDGAVGFCIGNKGYLGTGKQFLYSVEEYKFYSDFWEYDPDANSWIQKVDFGGGPRNSAVAWSIGEKGYLGCGDQEFFTCFKDLWEYDPPTNQWSRKTDFGGEARTHAAGFSIGSHGYIGTGEQLSSEEYNDFWEYTACNGLTIYADFDGDGYGDISNNYFAPDCAIPNGYVSDDMDCDDADNSINPHAEEILNGIDDNCNGIIDDIFCEAPLNLSATDIRTTSVKLSWSTIVQASSYTVIYRKAGASEWNSAHSAVNQKTITGLTANTEYTWNVFSVCHSSSQLKSDRSEFATFITDPLRIGDSSPEISFQIYPNPSSQQTSIQFTLLQSSHVCVKVYDVSGKEITTLMDNELDHGDHTLVLNTSLFSRGLYMVKIISDFGIENQKLIVE
jgi:N-acetylneuraminic acid mutarotase